MLAASKLVIDVWLSIHQETARFAEALNFCLLPGPCKVGIGICYDIRFAELAQIYAQEGCHLLVYPGAFNMTTGPAHWETLQKARLGVCCELLREYL